MKNLIEALTDEIVRVEKVKDIYAGIPAGALYLNVAIIPALKKPKKHKVTGKS